MHVHVVSYISGVTPNVIKDVTQVTLQEPCVVIDALLNGTPRVIIVNTNKKDVTIEGGVREPGMLRWVPRETKPE